MRCCPRVSGVEAADSRTRRAAFASVLRKPESALASSSRGRRRSSGTGPSWSPYPSTRTESAARRRSESSSSCCASFPRRLIAPFAGVLGRPLSDVSASCSSRNLARIVLVSAAAACVFLDAPAGVGVRARRSPPRSRTRPFRSAQAALTPSLARYAVGAHRSERRREQRSRASPRSPAPLLAGLLLVALEHRIGVRRHCRARRRFDAASSCASASTSARRPAAGSRRRRSRPRRLAGFRAIAPRSGAARARSRSSRRRPFVAGAVQVFLVDHGDRAPRARRRRGRIPQLGRRSRRVHRRASLALSLAGAARLSPAFMLGVVLWGHPLIVVGADRRSAVLPSLVFALHRGRELARRRRRVHAACSALFPTRCSPASSASSRCSGSLRSGSEPAHRARRSSRAVGVETALDRHRCVACRLSSSFSARAWSRDRLSRRRLPTRTTLRLLGATPIFAPLPGGSARASRVATRAAPRRGRNGRSCARATPATASTSWPRVTLDVIARTAHT